MATPPPVNVSIPLPRLTAPNQCYFVQAVFRTQVTVTSVTDDAGNTYQPSVTLSKPNFSTFAYFAMTPTSATTLRIVYTGGFGKTEQDLVTAKAIKVDGAAQLKALNQSPPWTQWW